MRVLFIGSSEFGLKCLKSLSLIKKISIAGVISNKRKFSISYSKKPVTNVLYADFKNFSLRNKITYYEMKHNMKEKDLVRFIDKTNPDLILVVGWYHMIPLSVLCNFKVVGMHASLLPKYSGGAPLVWALINGEKQTGITLFLFDKGVDSGPIIGQAKVKIDDHDTIASLYAKVEEKGIQLLRRYLPKIAHGTVLYKKQDNRKRTIYPQRKPEDGLINWDWSVEKIRNFIRAQTRPYPGAYTIIKNKKIIIWDANISEL